MDNKKKVQKEIASQCENNSCETKKLLEETKEVKKKLLKIVRIINGDIENEKQ